MRRDSTSKAEVSIDTNHEKVHAGMFFQFEIAKTGLANAGVYKAYFTTPVTGYIHWKRPDGWMSLAQLNVDLYEGMTATTTGGKSVSVYNCNRSSSRTAGITVKESATVTAGGSVRIDRTILGGGGATPASRAGGQTNLDEEITLKQNTKYSVWCTNLSGASATFQVKQKFYIGGL